VTTIYRNYTIARVGEKFVARSTDDDCLLVSSSQQRLNTAIDDLWDGLERGAEPAWFCGSSAIDVDTFGPQSAPSSSDPPSEAIPKAYKVSYWMFALTAVLVSAPASYLFEVYAFPRRVDVLLSLGVCAVAVAFGRRYALLMTAIAAVVFNFCAIEPLLDFSIPSCSEAAFCALNVAASYIIPALIKWRLSGRGASWPRRIRDI
jgi:hypothetical protein